MGASERLRNLTKGKRISCVAVKQELQIIHKVIDERMTPPERVFEDRL
jgi:hypothetical protein